MYVIIEYESDGITVSELHGPFDSEKQAEDWAAAPDREFSGRFEVMGLSSVT